MRAMNPKILKILIIGIALLIFGPVLGWAFSIFGLFQTQQAIVQTPPGTFPNFDQIPSRMMANLIPMLIGAFCGAVGFFLTLYAFITHFFGPKSNP